MNNRWIQLGCMYKDKEKCNSNHALIEVYTENHPFHCLCTTDSSLVVFMNTFIDEHYTDHTNNSTRLHTTRLCYIDAEYL